MTSFLTTGGIRGHKKKKLGKFYPRSFNMGLSREVYLKIGGFGKLRHGQDIEFSNRIIKSGAKVISIAEAIVYHKRRTSMQRFFKQVFNWGVARINLYKLDRSMLEPVHFLPAAATILLILLLILSILNWAILKYVLGFGILILFMSGMHAAFRYKDLKMLILIPLVIPTQIFGYGLGFLLAFFWRIILKKGEFVGFRKKYYN
jgi:GT2 family glycosyltransferase